MLKKFICAAFIIAVLCMSARAEGISAECAILMDCETGRVFYAKNEDATHLIASTTKIMTALAVIENCALDERVRITREAMTEGSSMYLRVGEDVSVEELLYGLMLMSGNDAASALAIHCGGTEKFTALMNEKAAELGLEKTHFANPHGLDAPDNYSTARDLAVLAAYAMQNEIFARICGTKTVDFSDRSMKNHNKLLWQYEGVCGVKTGYTRAAGRCLVSLCERNGRKLVLVTLNDPDDWRDHMALYDEMFGTMEERILAEKDGVAAEIPLADGGCVKVKYAESFKMYLAPDEYVEIKIEAPHFIYKKENGIAGKAGFFINGKRVKSVPLYYE